MNKEMGTENNYSNHYVKSDILPTSFVTNISNSLEGYPKLLRLRELKLVQIQQYSVKSYGSRIQPLDMVSRLTSLCDIYKLQFDVIMIGGISNTQKVLQLLRNIPLAKLCSKPGFLFVWTSRQQIEELSEILNQDYNKKFRRSEELVFLPMSKSSKYYPKQDIYSVFENQQLQCWMCITGTVRRSVDQHLIHCNIDTDLQFENHSDSNIVPDQMYRIAENFSNFNRRLHIIPNKVEFNRYVKPRPGWVIISPDILLNNFNPLMYQRELQSKSLINYKNNQMQFLVGQTDEIEDLRPKSPRNQ